MSDIVLPHAALIDKEEHLINLFLIIFLQLLLFNSKLGSKLLKLFFLSLICSSELLQLLF